ncbi:MAG: PhoPQ-activated pathogenicity, partial [Candidatus Hydrogenedentes bacterium]|nr:PhoPQ-activated pathogenicity [Candidatus Hydrogenedentota bacterium]
MLKRASRLVFIAIVLAAASVPTAYAGPLADYAYTPDSHYGYTVHSRVECDGYITYVLDLTSQAWAEGQATPAVWRHWLTVVVPDQVEHSRALLSIQGGRRTASPPTAAPAYFVNLATTTKSVVAILRDVPNQPLVFAGEGKERVEDEIVAYTFAQFAETGDPHRPLLCPMVKSAVRAMDAVQSLCVKDMTPPVMINGFVVTGVSKRGWTTWLTGA